MSSIKFDKLMCWTIGVDLSRRDYRDESSSQYRRALNRLFLILTLQMFNLIINKILFFLQFKSYIVVNFIYFYNYFLNKILFH